MPEAIASSSSSPLPPARETSGECPLFSYGVRQLIRDPEAMSRQAFLDLLGKMWQQVGFEPTSFARDFLKFPPTRLVYVSTVTSDGATKVERRVINKGINQEPLDLHRLYCEVWKLDGFRNVTEKHQWQLVAVACNFLRAEKLSKPLVGKPTAGKLGPCEQQIVTNTSNTYERYLFQFELRMTDARRILTTQARRPLNGLQRGCHYLHAIGGSVENNNSTRSHKPSNGTTAPPVPTLRCDIRRSRAMVPQPAIVQAHIEPKPISGPGVNGKEECHKVGDGVSAAESLAGEVEGQEKAPTKKLTRGTLSRDSQVHGLLGSSAEGTAVQPSKFLPAVQGTGMLRQKQCHQHTKATNAGNQLETQETSKNPLEDLDFSDFAWVDQFEEDIASPTLRRDVKTNKNRRSSTPAWYRAAGAQRPGAGSTKVTRSDCVIQIPGPQHREHIVPEEYWANESRRLGISPAEPEDSPVTRGLLGLVESKGKSSRVKGGSSTGRNKSNDKSIRKFGHCFRGLGDMRGDSIVGKSQQPLFHRIFRSKAVSKESDCNSEMPVVGCSDAGIVEGEERILDSNPPSSYPSVSQQEAKTETEMTYRAKVEGYE
ncbi:MAG: hypothetical protein M1839_000556 [Geoglossum umbratile]|nr:MAG: hypothetical protein M1839_000556 [Geoglossum umbratile]